MTKIKICGLTREEDVVFAADKGADFLGFIFVPSTPRFIEPERAAAITASIRQRDQRPKLVGVFRDASADYVREIASVVGLDFVQLHGTESDQDVRAMGIPAIKSFRVGDTLPDTTAHPAADWLLFDSFEERRAGGTGRRFDWSLLAAYPRTKPFFLAGGLSPENVAAAISLARPDAIDVSSGVELEPGVKDHARIDELIKRVRRS
jgi:phosphoribosylanthranilate isomerase